MTDTLITNYKEVLKENTLEFIEGLLEENHDLECILEFINEHSEQEFIDHYEDYVEQGEKIGYDVVDAFLTENDLSGVEHCQDAFQGYYSSEENFAEQLHIEKYGEPHDQLVIDWKKTWELSYSDDYDYVNGYVFYRHW